VTQFFVVVTGGYQLIANEFHLKKKKNIDVIRNTPTNVGGTYLQVQI
jgi:hypothetical protein